MLGSPRVFQQRVGWAKARSTRTVFPQALCSAVPTRMDCASIENAWARRCAFRVAAVGALPAPLPTLHRAARGSIRVLPGLLDDRRPALDLAEELRAQRLRRGIALPDRLGVDIGEPLHQLRILQRSLQR